MGSEQEFTVQDVATLDCSCRQWLPWPAMAAEMILVAAALFVLLFMVLSIACSFTAWNERRIKREQERAEALFLPNARATYRE